MVNWDLPAEFPITKTTTPEHSPQFSLGIRRCFSKVLGRVFSAQLVGFVKRLLRVAVHPHPSPLPSRERGQDSPPPTFYAPLGRPRPRVAMMLR